MTTLAFVDTETTGLDADEHEIWEVGLVLAYSDDPATRIKQCQWLLDANPAKGNPISLNISGFHERHPKGWKLLREPEPNNYANRLHFAIEFGRLTYGAHLVGAVPSFDEERLRKLLLNRGFSPGWHYHPIDIEAMAVGYLRGRRSATSTGQGITDLSLPWKSDDLSRACGVEPPNEEDRHTALGDARWAHRWYCALVGEI